METDATHFLRDGLILLGFALAFVLVFRRLGLGATLGYLVAGALVGPHALGLVGGAQGKIDFAELGIVLLFTVLLAAPTAHASWTGPWGHEDNQGS